MSTTSPSAEGPAWISGAWLGWRANTQTAQSYGDWRGSPATGMSAGPNTDTWDRIKNAESEIAQYDNFNGRLIFSVPLLPTAGDGSLSSVAAGDHDEVWTAIAKDLVKHGHADAILRIGQEANGADWFRWGATAQTADDYVAAYRHVAKVMKAVSPDFVTNFDISAGHALNGSTNRMDPLTKLYPGDDVVDVIGVDHYDMWDIAAKNDAEWESALSPKYGPGLSDVAAFAAGHGKKFSIPEWGVAGADSHGNGDNPFFIDKMADFMQSHRDSLMYETYFEETDRTRSALFLQDINPRSAQEYINRF